MKNSVQVKSAMGFGGAVSWLRMFNSEVGGQVAWLISVPSNWPFGCSGKDIQKPFASEPAATLSR